MSFESDIDLLQEFAGVKRDKVFGPVTAAALVRKLQLAPVLAEAQPQPGRAALKVCIDPGHGMSNRKDGVFDPGCVRSTLQEADVALEWALELRSALTARGIPTFLTRENNETDCSLTQRAGRAKDAGCTHLISIHVNDADAAGANGTETWYRDDKSFAELCQQCLLAGLNLRDRGVKQGSFAVLAFDGKAALLELGFIGAPGDVRAFTSSALVAHTCRMLADIF